MNRLITFTRNISFICAFSCASLAHSAYLDYSVDETSGTVTGNGYEWLRWDQTLGMSIDEALTTYSSDGWRVASNSEMAFLFNDFGVNYDMGNYITYDADENTGQSVWDDSASTPYYLFQEMFGVTSTECYGWYPEQQCLTESGALFGNDGDGDLQHNLAWVLYSQWENVETGEWVWYDEAWSGIDGDNYSPTNTALNGVALVRDVTHTPIPGALPLFASAMIVFGWFYRRKKQQ